MPTFISREAADLLYRMLNKNPAKRITIPQVKEHPFFKTINWEDLAAQKVAPPLILSSKDCDDDGSD